VTLGLIGHVKATLNGLLPLLDKKRNRSFLDKALGHYKDSRKELDEQPTGNQAAPPSTPNMWPRSSMNLPVKMPFSPAM